RVDDGGGEGLALRLFRGALQRSEAKGGTVARFQEGTFLVGVQDPLAHKNRFTNSEQVLSSSELRTRIDELKRRGERRDAARLGLELARRWAVPLAVVFF